MAELEESQSFSLMDRAKLTSDGKTVQKVISVMNKKIDDLFRDIPSLEANRGFNHQILRDVEMASSTRVSLGGFVKATKRGSQVVLEPVGLMKRRSQIPDDHLDTLTNPNQERDNQDRGHIQKLAEDVLYAFLHDNPSSGNEYCHGLESRLNKLSQTLENTYDGGYTTGGSTCTSIYIVDFNTTEGCFMIYPPGNIKNTEYGISVKNRGLQQVGDETNGYRDDYVVNFKAWFGLAVVNERKIARIANINPDNAASGSFAYNDEIMKKIVTALNLGRFDRTSTRIILNENVKAGMDIYAALKGNVYLTSDEVFGREVLAFQHIPIRVVDRKILLNTEAVVAA